MKRFLLVVGALLAITCALGEEYRFLVRPAANADKLLVFFESGGACWDGAMCDPAYYESVAGANHLWRDQTFDTELIQTFPAKT